MTIVLPSRQEAHIARPHADSLIVASGQYHHSR